MILYIMRHAEAVDGNENLQDSWRYLTEKGRAIAENMSSQIIKSSPKPRLTITSPLTRAVQTAEIVAKYACRRNKVVASELLLPEKEISEVISHLADCQKAKRVILIGHEPQLGLLVAQLLGRPSGEVSIKSGACVALELHQEDGDKPANFLWYHVPGKKRIKSYIKAFTKP